ncbi:MAG: MFS transporter [Anaerolineae bacterium]|nr:MFS transporter [Anaerolineae bacterium]
MSDDPKHPLPPDAVPTDEPLTLAASINLRTLRALLTNRSFVALLLGQWASYTGDQFTLIAAIPVLDTLTGGNALVTAGVAIALALPQIIFGLVGGVLVDRLDRKVVMVGTDLIRGAAVVALVFVADVRFVWVFYVVGVIVGTSGTLFFPARAAALPAILPKRQLAAANALLEAGFVLALIFGSGVAGVLVDQFGSAFAFAFDASTYIFSGLLILTMHVPKVANAPTGQSAAAVWQELREGLVYIWDTRAMRYIMGLSVVVAAGLGAVIILVFEYLFKELGIDATGFGVVIATLGVGIIGGGVLIQRLSRFLSTNRLVAISLVINGLAVLGFIPNPPYQMVLLFAALIGFSVVVARAVLGTLTQAIPPDELRGRVQGAFNLVFSAPLALAIGLAGLALEAVQDPHLVFGGTGVLLLVTAFLSLVLLRGIDEMIYRVD